MGQLGSHGYESCPRAQVYFPLTPQQRGCISLYPRGGLMLTYCGYPATVEYIETDLKARGLSKQEIERSLLEVLFANIAHNALKLKQAEVK